MKRILLDTDLAMGAPGSDIDDGFALALAVADPEIDVELVTTVGGNSDVATSTRLTEELLDRIGRGDIPIVQGAGVPLDPRWRHPARPGSKPDSGGLANLSERGSRAASAIVDRVRVEPGEFTIVAIGPLTNVAMALMLEPELPRAVAGIVVMGGVYLEHTNVAAMPGEYNFWCDPLAASIVLAGGGPLRLVGLDVTQRVRLTRDDTAALAATDKEFAPFAAACADSWIDFQERVKPGDVRERGSCALHDPLAVAAAVRPQLVSWQPAHVAVETTSQITRGVAIADLLRWENPPEHNCEIAVAVDDPGFRAYFLDMMARLP